MGAWHRDRCPAGSALATLELRSGWAAQKGHQKEGFWEEVILESQRRNLNGLAERGEG